MPQKIELLVALFALQIEPLVLLLVSSTTSASLSGVKRSAGRAISADKEDEMEKAYEEYFEGLADGEEALSFTEFVEALS
ncbi:hypothetical protein LJS90_004221 [Salmonella enterica]|nr:hypothetical protein [Salmonella enterica]HAZ2794364.1 hypothetical protein [Salmonella enterica]